MSAVSSRPWLKLVESISNNLEDGEPIHFVLGAGASLSSGGPSTLELEQQWMQTNPALFPNRKVLLEKISKTNDNQKINPIKPLFESVSPYIGYHCLASLGHDRPVFVLNLNWDDALEQACAATGVPFHHLTVDRDGDLVFRVEEEGEVKVKKVSDGEEPDFLTTEPTPGVHCLQVHGKLGDPVSGIRIGIYDTLRFDPIVRRTIVERFFSHPTVIAGASLQGEFDIVDLLRTLTEELADSSEQLPPIYVFSRQDQRTDKPTDNLTQHVLYRRSSDSNFSGDPAVDFDRLLIELATRLKAVDLQEPFERTAPIPSLEELAIPHHHVLGPPFDIAKHRAVVIEGDAKIGRSTAAGLLGHMARICDQSRPVIEVYSGPGKCEDALSALSKEGGSAGNRVLILEDPFGTADQFNPNKEFAKTLNKVLKAKPGTKYHFPDTRVIVNTRASSWRLAQSESTITQPDSLISVAIDDWYHSDELTAYLESKMTRREGPLLRREIHKGELATPAAIDDAVFKGGSSREETIAEKVEFLNAISPEARWCVILARLQELWPNGVADLPLHRAADRESPAFCEAKLMLREVTLDEQSYVIPAHSTDREAIDRYYKENAAEFDQNLSELSRRHGSPKDGCDLWQAVLKLRDDDLGRVENLPEEVLLNWGPALLEEAARCLDDEVARERFNKVREVLLACDQHFWSMRELVFETIRLWPMLKDDPEAHGFLDDILDQEKSVGNLDGGKRMGCYLVLEAMLYVQAATYPGTWDMAAYARVWDKLSAARYALLDKPEENAHELALLFDAFTWCPPRLEPNDLRRWLEPLLEVAPRCPQLRVAALCSSLYHPEGFEQLAAELGESGLRAEPRDFTAADAEIAAFMISWHFVHQSRGRALMYRRNLEPAHAYLLHRIPGPRQPTLPEDGAERCRQLVGQIAEFPEHRGWAVHLALSVAAQREGFEPSFAAKFIPKLRDGDQGAIAAAMTYKIPQVLLSSFREYFKREVNRDALVGAFSEPHEIDGVTVGPPPFCASRQPWQLYGPLGIEWPLLEEDRIPVTDGYELLEMLHSEAADLEVLLEATPGGAQAVRDLVREGAAGNLNRLEAVTHRIPSARWRKMTPAERLSARLRDAANGSLTNGGTGP